MNYLVLTSGSLLAAGLLWALVLGWWQSNDHQPTSSELWLHMGALPLALIGGFWLIRGFIEHLRKPAAAPSASPSATEQDPLATESARSGEAERLWQVAVLASGVVTAHGDSGEELVAALSTGLSPQPDPTLTDEDGFPIFSVRLPDLPIADFSDQLALDAPALHGLSDAAALRRLALLARLIEALAPAATDRLSGDDRLATLRVSILHDGPASAPTFASEQEWLKTQLGAIVPEACCTLDTRVVVSEGALLEFLDELIQRVNRGPELESPHLVLAATTFLDDAAVAQLTRSGQLFSPTNQDGVIPGEAAVGILIGRVPPGLRPEDAQLRLLSRAVLAERDAPPAAKGRSSAHVLEALAAAILDTHKLPADRVTAIVSDADHRATRTTELMLTTTERFPELDPAEDCLCIGKATGHVAPFGPLLAISVADAVSAQRNAPTLVVSNAHPTTRAALLLAPFALAAPRTDSSTTS